MKGGGCCDGNFVINKLMDGDCSGIWTLGLGPEKLNFDINKDSIQILYGGEQLSLQIEKKPNVVPRDRRDGTAADVGGISGIFSISNGQTKGKSILKLVQDPILWCQDYLVSKLLSEKKTKVFVSSFVYVKENLPTKSYYTFMEEVNSLSDYINKKSISGSKAYLQNILIQSCTAMIEFEDMGLYFTDFKIQNMGIDTSNNIKFLDLDSFLIKCNSTQKREYMVKDKFLKDIYFQGGGDEFYLCGNYNIIIGEHVKAISQSFKNPLLYTDHNLKLPDPITPEILYSIHIFNMGLLIIMLSMANNWITEFETWLRLVLLTIELPTAGVAPLEKIATKLAINPPTDNDDVKVYYLYQLQIKINKGLNAILHKNTKSFKSFKLLKNVFSNFLDIIRTNDKDKIFVEICKEGFMINLLTELNHWGTLMA